MNHLSIRIEGGLLSPDFLETIHEANGQKPADFGLKPRDSLVDEVSAIWGDVLTYWNAFQRRKARAQDGRSGAESLTTITREQWLRPLLEALGYSLTFQRSAVEQDGRSYLISHRAGSDESGPPVHLVAYDQALGDRPPSGRAALSPHALVQDYLNRTDEHLWGVVSNGRILRLLRDSTYFTRPAYIEFDLEQMIRGERLDEFFLLYRLAHRSRLPQPGTAPADCLLEQYHQAAIEQGGRIRDGLRQAVADAILTLGNGFLRHPRNESLRQRLHDGGLTAEAYYQQLLYLIYRLLFLMVAEERNLLEIDQVTGGHGDAVTDVTHSSYYRQYFSVSRLRALADTPLSAPERFDDLYLGLCTLFYAFHDESLAAQLGVPPLNGELFSSTNAPDLDAAHLNNRDLLAAVRLLSYFTPPDEKVRRRVNYAALDVEELGSVYESLLDEQPVLDTATTITSPGHPVTFSFVSGTTRKTTGSYYTPRELVNEVIKSALVPVIEARLDAASLQPPVANRQPPDAPNPQAKALLALRVCDPACGSGHFLLAAARRIGYELAKVRANADEPSPDAVRAATREAITHCIYGVDKNPLAVDLCKVALWIEGHSRGKPLTFLDYRIRCGDSLVGVLDVAVLDEGIPDAAFDPVSGDDKTTARGLKKQNKAEREGQMSLFDRLGGTAVAPDGVAWQAFEQMPEDTPAQVNAKRARYDELRGRSAQARTAANLWTAAFFSQLTPENLPNVPTTDVLRRYRDGQPVSAQVVGAANALAEDRELRFFHWPLEFPQVFATPPVIPNGVRGARNPDGLERPGERDSSGDTSVASAQALGMTGGRSGVIPSEVFGARNPDGLGRSGERDSSEDTSVASAQALGMTGGRSGVIPSEVRGARNPDGLGRPGERDSSEDLGMTGVAGGFDVVLGNPPWERIKLQEQEFFATRDPDIATAANKAARQKLIKKLPQNKPKLAQAFARAKHDADATSKFTRQSGRFPLTAVGDINAYTLFVELMRQLFKPQGRTCVICPPGIASDDTTKAFFNDLMEKGSLVSLVAFVNEKMIFPEVLHNFRFCMFSLAGSDWHIKEAQFAYECQTFDDIKQEERFFTLNADDLALLNPNTRTAPVFRSKADAELTKKIYSNSPVLINENSKENPWGISFMRMLDMSNDSNLFNTKEELKNLGYKLLGNAFVNEKDYWLPLYEGKLIHQFDHRFASFENSEGIRLHMLPPVDLEKHQNPNYVPLPYYFVNQNIVERNLEAKWQKGWLLGFRDVTSKSLERTATFCLMPRVGFGNKVPLLLPEVSEAVRVACLLGCVNSMLFDYTVRQKISGATLNFFIVKQLPVLPPDKFEAKSLIYIVPRVLELVYTAWDISPFAADIWQEADEPLRHTLRAQWEANRQATGGHAPDKVTKAQPVIPSPSHPHTPTPPFPPFKWDDNRRAQLRAELDAYYARLYGLSRDELRYILDPADIYGPDFPGETFRVLKEKEIKQHGEYRTQRLVLAAWDAQETAIAQGELVFDTVTGRPGDRVTDEGPAAVEPAQPVVREPAPRLELKSPPSPAQPKAQAAARPALEQQPALVVDFTPPQGSFAQRLKRVNTIGQPKNQVELTELIAALGDENDNIRWLAGSALAKVGGLPVVRLLGAYLATSPGPTAQAEVRRVLQLIGEMSEDEQIRSSAQNLLRN